MTEIQVSVEKDEETELPIPNVWWPVFSNIVGAFVNGEVWTSIPALRPYMTAH